MLRRKFVRRVMADLAVGYKGCQRTDAQGLAVAGCSCRGYGNQVRFRFMAHQFASGCLSTGKRLFWLVKHCAEMPGQILPMKQCVECLYLVQS